MKKLFIDLHAIQTVPPSNINRDDTGSPKTAQYGGVTRSRVSSQSWKKAMRDYFKENGDLKNAGVRSRNVVHYVATKIMEKDESIDYDEAMKKVEKMFKTLKIETTKGKTKALFFISSKQAENLAQASIEDNATKKDLQAILKAEPAIDIALFGRMLAGDAAISEDASSQVAHAISTHAIQTEFDFFTATDDLSQEDHAGAGMLGTVEFNSSTLYRYANINLHEFSKQLKDDSEALSSSVQLFVEAFMNSMPTGKVNTFANQTLPQAVLVVGRTDRPVNLVTAFEEPVVSRNGYVSKSIENLESEFKSVLKFVEEPEFVFSIGLEDLANEQNNMDELLKNLGDKVSEFVERE